MTLDGDGGGDDTTAKNTSLDWLSDFKAVQAKLSGMVDYAKALSTVSMNLADHRIRVFSQMNQVLTAGAFAGGFPEVQYTSVLHQNNMEEFAQYIQHLYDGIFHTANAAKAVADAYGDSDSFSAISLDAVSFAFGDPDAKRPEGLPARFGQTFSQQEAEALAKGTDTGRPASMWVPTGTVINADGGMMQTYIDQYGQTRTITISYDANGHQITTTTDPTGTTVADSSTYSYPLGTYTVTTTTGPDGKVTTSSSNSYWDGQSVVTDESSNGDLTSETKVTTNPGDSETTTVSTMVKGKLQVNSEITIDQDNPVNNGAPDSPAQDAIDQIQSSMPKDKSNTVILAPGAPGSTPIDSGGGGTAV